MQQMSIISWVLLVSSFVVFIPLISIQLLVILKPDSRKTKDLIIGNGEDWRDKTHKKSALAFAWADWILLAPLLMAGNIGVIAGSSLGYILWIAAGVLSIYFSIICWVLEKEYVYPSRGAAAYYTYYWGSFLYWGFGSAVYSVWILV